MTQTGVLNLDAILGDGILDEGVLLPLSMSGSGKTDLDLSVIVHTPRPTARASSTPPEPTARPREHFRRFSCRDESPIGKRLLRRMSLDVDKMDSWVVRKVERFTPQRLAADNTGIACLAPRWRGNQGTG